MRGPDGEGGEEGIEVVFCDVMYMESAKREILRFRVFIVYTL